jgi:hypothetical protein
MADAYAFASEEDIRKIARAVKQVLNVPATQRKFRDRPKNPRLYGGLCVASENIPAAVEDPTGQWQLGSGLATIVRLEHNSTDDAWDAKKLLDGEGNEKEITVYNSTKKIVSKDVLLQWKWNSGLRMIDVEDCN